MDGLVRAAFLGLFAALGLVGVACGGPQEPAEEGADCYRDADCKVGLVCVPKADNSGARTCSGNISGLVSQVDRPPPPEPPEPPEDAGTTDGASTPMEDGGEPPMEDGGEPPMEDGGEPPMEDGGEPPMEDAGQ